MHISKLFVYIFEQVAYFYFRFLHLKIVTQICTELLTTCYIFAQKYKIVKQWLQSTVIS